VSTLISRDPFARQELHREKITRNPKGECQWCGQEARFTYYVERDGGGRNQLAGVFCAIGCMRSYHS